MKITIKGKEITLKQSFRTAIIYENITKESFGSGINTTNLILYFYCTVLGSDKDLVLDFDEFIDILDEMPNKLSEYADWLATINGIDSKINGTKKNKRQNQQKN